jgi:ERCC4-type nuclease
VAEDALSVVADHREARSGVPAALANLDVRVVTATLHVGDYLIGEHTRIERQTIRDLHASVVTRRLWSQLNRLRMVAKYPIVLVEGRDLDAGPLSPSGIRGVLIAMSDRGIPVIRATDPYDSAMWLRSLARARDQGRRIHVAAPYRRPTGVRDPPAVEVLRSIPRLSLRNARDLVASFGSVQTVANASLSELQRVPGIGELRAAAIHDTLTRSP